MHIFFPIVNIWKGIWFREINTLPLEIIRMGVGALLFITYALNTQQDLALLYGDGGYVPKHVLTAQISDPFVFSIFYFFTEHWQLLSIHVFFLFSCLALTLGWRTAWLKWIVLFGHLSYINRNPVAHYGVDSILASLLFVLCIAPIGKNMSLDRVRQIRKVKKIDLTATVPAFTSQWAFACTRLIQIQMVALFFYSATEKLYGDSWWAGEALWIAMLNNETAFFPMEFLAQNFWLINVMSYATILVEISYCFLIWGQKTRPYLLSLALILHLGIAVMLGMYFFALAMSFGHLAFVRHEWIKQWLMQWQQKMGSIEMIYDGDCGFSKRSMAVFLAFDGLEQISIRNYRTDPSPVVISPMVDKALYVVADNNIALPGFEAYRYIVPRVPGLWWMVPLFYIPYLSRAVGTPVYNWIATHRDQISTCVVDTSRTQDQQN